MHSLPVFEVKNPLGQAKTQVLGSVIAAPGSSLNPILQRVQD